MSAWPSISLFLVLQFVCAKVLGISVDFFLPCNIQFAESNSLFRSSIMVNQLSLRVITLNVSSWQPCVLGKMVNCNNWQSIGNIQLDQIERLSREIKTFFCVISLRGLKSTHLRDIRSSLRTCRKISIFHLQNRDVICVSR